MGTMMKRSPHAHDGRQDADEHPQDRGRIRGEDHARFLEFHLVGQGLDHAVVEGDLGGRFHPLGFPPAFCRMLWRLSTNM